MSSPSQPSSGSEPQPARPESAPDKNGIDTATDVEIQRRFNELRRELLDHRVKLADWWLAVTAGFLTFFGVVAVIVGFFGFEELRDFKDKAHEDMMAANKHAEEAEKQAMRAERVVKEIEATHDEAQALLKDMNAETVHNDPDKASEVVETVQQSPVASPIDRAVAAAISLQQQGEIGQAIEKWRSIANVAEGVDRQLQARAWFSVGYLHGEEDNWEAALDAYNEAIRLKPDVVAYNNRGNAKDILGQHEAALADYNEAIRLKPDYAYAHNGRGIARGNLGQHEAALVDYNEAIRLKPDMVEARYNRGNVKRDLGQYEAALEDYDKAIELKPDYAEAHNNRGIVKSGLGRLDEAREDYQKALALAQESGDEDLIAKVERNLSQLDNNKAP